MRAPPLVSIAIIAYNQERFIADAIQGAVDQDYAPLEVIVADDCSTDRTRDIIGEFARRYPGLVVPLLGQENLGVTGNSNRALQACRGEYIAMLGGDDVLLPGKVARQVAWMEEDDRRVFCGHACEMFFDDQALPPIRVHPTRDHGRGAQDIIVNGPPYFAPSVLFRKSAVPSYGFDASVPIASDFMLWIDLARHDGLWGSVSGVYARYRRHAGSLSHISRHDRLLEDTKRVIRTAVRRYGLEEYEDTATMNLITLPRLARLFRQGMYRELAVELLKPVSRQPLLFVVCSARLLATRIKAAKLR